MTDENLHLWLGAYLLGGLSAAERNRFEQHLSGCARCRTELADTAPIPGLLRRAAAPARPTPPSLLPRLQAEIVRGRRRRQRLTAIAGLGAAALAIAAVVVAAQPAATPTGRNIALSSATGFHVHGVARLEPKPWGTAMVLDISGLPPQQTFQLTVTKTRGQVESAATWSSTPGGHVVVQGASSVTEHEITRITVTGANGTALAQGRP